MAIALSGLGRVIWVKLRAGDRPVRQGLAVCLFAWAEAIHQAIDDPRPPVEQADVDRDFTLIRKQLDEAAIAAAGAEGRSMAEAIAYALETGSGRSPTA